MKSNRLASIPCVVEDLPDHFLVPDDCLLPLAGVPVQPCVCRRGKDALPVQFSGDGVGGFPTGSPLEYLPDDGSRDRVLDVRGAFLGPIVDHLYPYLGCGLAWIFPSSARAILPSVVRSMIRSRSSSLASDAAIIWIFAPWLVRSIGLVASSMRPWYISSTW